ncbi:MAG: universal stress protein [Caldilineaceae bacterium]|nr:universal stress protein [Caldilineaceae bacterium]
MYQKILVPLDGSPFAEGVLSYISQVSVPHETEIVLLQVLQVERYSAYLTPGPLPISGQPVSHWRQFTENYHASVMENLRSHGYTASSEIVNGSDVAAEICRYADAARVDLIAMTTHARTGLPRWVLGSVASRVLSATDKPVFLVNPTEELQDRTVALRRILVPLDGSHLAEEVLSLATSLAHAQEARLILVRALDPPAMVPADPSMRDLTTPMASQLGAVEMQAAEFYMQDIANELQRRNIVEQTVVIVGDAADVILDTAEINDVDLIAMCTHGRSGVSRWVYGSVAEKVLHRAPCPLLLLRAQKP